MKAFIKWLGNRFHNHQWEILEEHELIIRDYYDSRMEARGMRFVLRCGVCGEIKHKDIR